MRHTQVIPRLVAQAGRFYWKPGRALRPAFRTVPLGDDEARARAEARRLNALADKWLASGRAARPVRRDQPMSVAEIIGHYKASGQFADLAARTRAQYAYGLRRIEDEFGHEPAATLDTVRVDAWADALRKTAPQTLRQLGSHARVVFAWAGRRKFVPPGHNPFREMRLGSGNKRKVRLTWGDVSHLRAVAAKMGLASLGHALAVAFLTVQRITDVLALTVADIEEEQAGAAVVRSLRFRQSKTGFEVDQAWPEELDRMLGLPSPPAAVATGRPPRGALRHAPEGPRPLIVSERSGRRWDEKYASRLFARIVAAAIAEDPRTWGHLKGAQLRDGRRSGFVHGILGGATVEIMCSLSGHTIEEGYSIVEHYLPKTRAAADKARAFMRVSG